MLGNGTIELCRSGVRMSVSFDITWAGDSAFVARFSNMLGMTVASVKADGHGKWAIAVADSQYTVCPDSDIAIGEEFMTYPVSWKEFLSVLTGRLPCAFALSQEPDTHYSDEKNTAFSWKSMRCGARVVDITGKIDNKKQSLSEIVYDYAPHGRGDGFEGWTLTASRFANGHAKEFKFAQYNNNYFYITYRSMKLRSSAEKRKKP